MLRACGQSLIPSEPGRGLMPGWSCGANGALGWAWKPLHHLGPKWRICVGGAPGYPLQHACLENAMDRGAWWATVHGVPKSWT